MARIILALGLLVPLGAAAVILAHGCGSSGGGTSSDGGGGEDAGKDTSATDGPNGGMDGGVDAGNLDAARAAIKHVVIINQENRSFDSYFGTFPGADGIPMDGGTPTVCVQDPRTHECVKPYHDMNDENAGGPHSAQAFADCTNDGGMNGFIASAEGKDGGKQYLCDAGDI